MYLENDLVKLQALAHVFKILELSFDLLRFALIIDKF
jgi:hypothetical protein